MSRWTVTDRANVTVDDIRAFVARFAGNASALAELAAVVAQHRGSGTAHALGIAEAELLSALGSHVHCYLARLTLAPPLELPISTFLGHAEHSTLSGCLTVCERHKTGTTHAHGLALCTNVAAAEALGELICSTPGLHASAVEIQNVRGWIEFARGGSDEALARSLRNILRYDLALEHWALKKEVPLRVVSWGQTFDAATEIMSRLIGNASATVTDRTCAADGCVKSVLPPRRDFCSDECADRQRQRRYRAKLRSVRATLPPRVTPGDMN